MLKRIVIAGTTLLALAVSQLATAGVLVAFRDKASVASSLVTLGDVAELHATDAADEQRLSTVILGPAPVPGRDGTITFETVRSRLLAAGVDLAEVEFSGPASVPVSVVATPSEGASRPDQLGSDTASRVEQVVVQAIRRHLATQSGGESFDVSATLTAEATQLLASAVTRGVDVSGGQAPWPGQQTFRLKLLDASDQIREVQVACNVASRPSVLAAKRALPRGHVIGPDDLVWKKAETNAEAAGITNPQELLGHETQQALRAGEPIRRDLVKRLPLVRNGQFVTVSSRRPGLAVQRVMKAKADGAFGEVIAFQTLETHKTVLARVTGLLQADVIDAADAASPKSPRARDERIAGAPSIPHQELSSPQESIPRQDLNRPAAAMNDMPRVYVNPVHPMSVPVSMVEERP